jgi:Predicted integral membrane protein
MSDDIKNENDKEIIEDTAENEEDSNAQTQIYTTQQKQKDDAEKNDEEQAKTKFNLFTTVDRFGDLFFLNILFVLTSIPIITMGASIAAMYSVVLKMAKNEEGPVSREYFGAFKKNFKQSTICWIIILIIGVIVYLEYGTMLSAGQSTTGDILMVLIGIEMIILTVTLPLLFPLIVRYENTTGKMFLNSFILAVSNLGTWLAIVLAWAIPIAISALVPNLFLFTWYLWILILTSTIAYANAFSIWKLFEKLEKRGGHLTEQK